MPDGLTRLGLVRVPLCRKQLIHRLTMSKTLLLIFSLAIFGSVSSAPADAPVRIPLAIPDDSGILSNANEQVVSFTDTTFKNAAALNSLVSENLITSVDNVNNGFSAATNAFRTQIQSTSDLISKQLDSTGKTVSQATQLVHQTAAQGAKSLADGVEVGTRSGASAVKGISDSIANAQHPTGIFSEQPRKVETAILETESIPSRALSVKENIQKMFAGIFRPKPIVDTITEEEKYGNNGDKFEPVGRALVSGTESLLGFLSNAVNIPFELAKSFTRSASASLNNLGGRLIGL